MESQTNSEWKSIWLSSGSETDKDDRMRGKRIQ
jgi:hypothetical protein